MKKILYVSVALLGLATSCNDDYSDQFNLNGSASDVKNTTFTLTDDQYGTVANSSVNKEIALSQDPENETALNALLAVGKQKYFTGDASAETYLPALLDAMYPMADNGSKYVVTYNMYKAPAAYMSDFSSVSIYDLSEDNYAAVWGDKVKASFLSPSTVNYIPSILKKDVTGAKEGDMKVVNYAYSEVEPSIGGGSTPEVTYAKISDVIAGADKIEYTVKGEVVATYAKGFLINDGTATMLVYNNAMPNYSLGDVVTVNGTVSKYNGMMQFPNTSTITRVERKTSFSYPTSAKAMTGAELTSYVSSPTIKYATMTGTLTISGNYYNVKVEGSTPMGSISYPVGGIVNPDLNGKEVTVTGYLIGGSTKYVNMMATSVVEKGTTSSVTPIGKIILSDPGTYTAEGTVAALYSRGFLLTDGTANVLVYLNAAPTQQVGDVVIVKGKTSSYGGMTQFPKDSEITTVSTGGKFYAPAATAMTGTDLDAYIEAPYTMFVTYEGTLSISGYYYNVAVDGATKAIGSIQYPADGVVDKALDGQKVVVTGYAIGASGGKYVSTMATKVVAASAIVRSLSRAVSVKPNASSLYRFDGKDWNEYSLSDAKVAVVDKDVYNSLGKDYIEKASAVLPIYLSNEYPYASNGDKVVVVYNKKADTPTAVEYTFEGIWSETTSSVPMTTTFQKGEDGKITANVSVHYENSLLGDDGGFSAANINLGGLSYVWSNTATYGFKASAFASGSKHITDSYLVSPSISLAKAKKPALVFEAAVNYLSPGVMGDFFNIYVSTDFANDDAASAKWIELKPKKMSDGASWTFVQTEDIDLSAYKGQTIRIAFRYRSTESVAPTVEVKNVKVYESEGNNEEK